MQEVAARGGRIILIGDAQALPKQPRSTSRPPSTCRPWRPTFTPIVYAVPVQMLAYHTAVFMGKDVDQPRNLAKSVTVE